MIWPRRAARPDSEDVGAPLTGFNRKRPQARAESDAASTRAAWSALSTRVWSESPAFAAMQVAPFSSANNPDG